MHPMTDLPDCRISRLSDASPPSSAACSSWLTTSCEVPSSPPETQKNNSQDSDLLLHQRKEISTKVYKQITNLMSLLIGIFSISCRLQHHISKFYIKYTEKCFVTIFNNFRSYYKKTSIQSNVLSAAHSPIQE